MHLEKRPIPRQSLTDRLLGKQDPMTPLAELWNALAEGRTGQAVRDEIAAGTDPDLWQYQTHARRDLLEEIIELAVADGELDDAELRFLRASAITLGIATDDADEVYTRSAINVYRRAVEQISHEMPLWSSDLPELAKLRSRLRIPVSVANQVETVVGIETTENLASSFSYDGQIDDTELEVLEQSLNKRGIGLEHLDIAVIDIIEESRQRYKFAQDPLQRVDLRELGIRLRGEACFCVCDASWYENRSQGGVQCPTHIATGTLLITEEGVRMLGSGTSKACPWKSVVSIDQLDLDTFYLQRTRGKSPKIRVTNTILPMLRGSPGIIAERLYHDS